MPNVMPDPYVGEIRIFCGNFQPKNWAFCDGRQLNIEDYETLFAVIGNTYGGDGIDTFALPNIVGRVPIGIGSGYNLGDLGGEETVKLEQEHLPQHNHTVYSNQEGGYADPVNNTWGYSDANPYSTHAANKTLNPDSLQSWGKSQAHENRIPYQVVNYIIALEGVIASQE